jgi:hypothetical protein
MQAPVYPMQQKDQILRVTLVIKGADFKTAESEAWKRLSAWYADGGTGKVPDEGTLLWIGIRNGRREGER